MLNIDVRYKKQDPKQGEWKQALEDGAEGCTGDLSRKMGAPGDHILK